MWLWCCVLWLCGQSGVCVDDRSVVSLVVRIMNVAVVLCVVRRVQCSCNGFGIFPFLDTCQPRDNGSWNVVLDGWGAYWCCLGSWE